MYQCLMHHVQNNVSPFRLSLGLFFKEKVTQCNDRDMLYQEMGVVSYSLFFLEHVINFEGLVIFEVYWEGLSNNLIKGNTYTVSLLN